MKKRIAINGQEREITIHQQDGECVAFTLDSVTYQYHRPSAPTRPFAIALKYEQGQHLFSWHGSEGVIDGWDVQVKEILGTLSSSPPEEDDIRSPMPGKILHIKVKAGESVEAGQVLAVMEAMKMEHTIKAPTAGVVSSIPWNPGDRVEGGIILVELEKKP